MNLPFLPKGTYRTKDGHIRYHTRGPLRGKYYHKVIAERLIEETPYSIRLLLPWPYEIHHIDHNKENNEPSNFLLCGKGFHSFMTCTGQNYKRKFQPKWAPAPRYIQEKLEGLDNEVPF